MSFLTNLEWRYATKLFDTTRKVSDENISKITDAIRLTPTSFGLQPYHFYVVSNQEMKDKIQAIAWNQPQIGTASHLIVFTARTDLMKNKEEYFELMTGWNPEIRNSLKGFEDMLTGFISAKSESDALAWASKQVYISHGFALAALAELQIDSCPMEWFDPTAAGEILGVPSTEKVLLILPIGYRAPTDGPRTPHKVRFSKEALFTEIK
jgi:nitroreductase/dihydropteridine reductase